MRLIRGLHNVPNSSDWLGCVATIGNFDGVHLGHQAILTQLNSLARQYSAPSLVVIFEPHPRELFAPNRAPVRLNGLRDKLALMAEQGVDYVLCLPFNSKMKAMTANAFIHDVLLQALKIKHLIVGDDFRFGCDRAGDYDALHAAGREHGFGVQNTQTHTHDGVRISSTAIRRALSSADLHAAQTLLGRDGYFISGRVGFGRQLGRTLNTPTANVLLKRHSLPLTGVYAVEVEHLEQPGHRHQGVANIGVKPTVAGVPEPSLEVHLFDFSGNLYYSHLRVWFKHKLRDEKAFDGLDALKSAIAEDKAAACRYFELTAKHHD